MLFVPVSGPRGMGEYARALALATAVVQRWPQLQVHFAVSEQAPYAADTPFPKTLLPSSPTFHNGPIAALIHSFRRLLASRGWQVSGGYFPVQTIRNMGAAIEMRSVTPGAPFPIAGATVRAAANPHGGTPAFAFRIEDGGRVTDPMGDKTQYGYDTARAWLTSVVDPNGTAVVGGAGGCCPCER